MPSKTPFTVKPRSARATRTYAFVPSESTTNLTTLVSIWKKAAIPMSVAVLFVTSNWTGTILPAAAVRFTTLKVSADEIWPTAGVKQAAKAKIVREAIVSSCD
jgi:hypothetical protein